MRKGSFRAKTGALPKGIKGVQAVAVAFGPDTPNGNTTEVGKGAAGNPYAGGGCTSWAWRNRQDLPGNLGDAGNWANNAARAGFPVDRTPEVGAIAVWPPSASYSDFGHVAYVERVEGGRIYISDASYYTGDNLIRRRYASATADGIRYIHRKGYSGPSGSPGGGSPAAPSPPPPRFADVLSFEETSTNVGRWFLLTNNGANGLTYAGFPSINVTLPKHYRSTSSPSIWTARRNVSGPVPRQEKWDGWRLWIGVPLSGALGIEREPVRDEIYRGGRA